ncbi:MAG: co-chaperone GroES [Firmicutes bacterium]|nr:co-chaperone GroES [Bacillota bacterium]
MEVKPLADRVLVEPIETEETTSSGIVLPDTAKEKPQQGRVVAVGSGRLANNGERVPMSVQVGDVVLFAQYAGSEVKIDGKEYLIMNENEILAVVSQ